MMKTINSQTPNAKYIKVWVNFRKVDQVYSMTLCPAIPFAPSFGTVRYFLTNEHGWHYKANSDEIAKAEKRGVVWFCYIGLYYQKKVSGLIKRLLSEVCKKVSKMP